MIISGRSDRTIPRPVQSEQQSVLGSALCQLQPVHPPPAGGRVQVELWKLHLLPKLADSLELGSWAVPPISTDVIQPFHVPSYPCNLPPPQTPPASALVLSPAGTSHSPEAFETPGACSGQTGFVRVGTFLWPLGMHSLSSTATHRVTWTPAQPPLKLRKLSGLSLEP